MSMILDGEPTLSKPPEVWEQWITHLKTLRRKYAGDPSRVRFLNEAIEEAEYDLKFVKAQGFTP